MTVRLPVSVRLSVYPSVRRYLFLCACLSLSLSLSVCVSLSLSLSVSVPVRACVSTYLPLSVPLVCLCFCLSLSACLPPVCIYMSLSFVRYSGGIAQTSEASTLPNLLSFSLFLRAHVLTSSSGAQMSNLAILTGGPRWHEYYSMITSCQEYSSVGNGSTVKCPLAACSY